MDGSYRRGLVGPVFMLLCVALAEPPSESLSADHVITAYLQKTGVLPYARVPLHELLHVSHQLKYLQSHASGKPVRRSVYITDSRISPRWCITHQELRAMWLSRQTWIEGSIPGPYTNWLTGFPVGFRADWCNVHNEAEARDKIAGYDVVFQATYPSGHGWDMWARPSPHQVHIYQPIEPAWLDTSRPVPPGKARKSARLRQQACFVSPAAFADQGFCPVWLDMSLNPGIKACQGHKRLSFLFRYNVEMLRQLYYQPLKTRTVIVARYQHSKTTYWKILHLFKHTNLTVSTNSSSMNWSATFGQYWTAVGTAKYAVLPPIPRNSAGQLACEGAVVGTPVFTQSNKACGRIVQHPFMTYTNFENLRAKVTELERNPTKYSEMAAFAYKAAGLLHVESLPNAENLQLMLQKAAGSRGLNCTVPRRHGDGTQDQIGPRLTNASSTSVAVVVVVLELVVLVLVLVLVLVVTRQISNRLPSGANTPQMGGFKP